jgi:RNA polymerase sigma-70 factor (ECF subfamily)
MESATDEQTMIGRAIAGDLGALERLLQAHHDRLLQYVARQLPEELKRTIEPADVVQDTFFEACRLIGGFQAKGDDSIFRWLVTIARHRMIDMLRAHRARPVGGVPQGSSTDASLVILLEQLAIYRRTPSRSAASHEFMAAIEGSLMRLPAEYREVVTLRHLQGLSVPETAARMNRSHDAVYWLCCRALQALRADLQSASLFV